jgi:hypothetical protein
MRRIALNPHCYGLKATLGEVAMPGAGLVAPQTEGSNPVPQYELEIWWTRGDSNP